jgi:hypothetical protein
MAAICNLGRHRSGACRVTRVLFALHQLHVYPSVFRDTIELCDRTINALPLVTDVRRCSTADTSFLHQLLLT